MYYEKGKESINCHPHVQLSIFKFGYPSTQPSGWTALQSHGRLTGATEERMSEVQLMDKVFNLVHGSGAQLKDENMKNPIKTTVEEIKKRCPDINGSVINFFTKMKYHARIKALNEQELIENVAERKRKAIERNEKPKKTKLMRDFVKDGHFYNN